MIYSPSSTSRFIQIVHGSLGHISQTTEKSSFTFGFPYKTHQIRNNIQISIVYIVFIILDLVVLDISFGYTSWFIRNFCKFFEKIFCFNFFSNQSPKNQYYLLQIHATYEYLPIPMFHLG